MFCEPNFMKREKKDDIEASVALPDILNVRQDIWVWARRSITHEQHKGQKFVGPVLQCVNGSARIAFA